MGNPRKRAITANTSRDPGWQKELREMSFAQFRADVKHARSRRRLYARINALPNSTVREELLAIAQRHEFGAR
jgi:hypothetical protein